MTGAERQAKFRALHGRPKAKKKAACAAPALDPAFAGIWSAAQVAEKFRLDVMTPDQLAALQALSGDAGDDEIEDGEQLLDEFGEPIYP